MRQLSDNRVKEFPTSRIATIDVCNIGKRKHHIPILLEVDVSSSREKLKIYRKHHTNASFTAWLVKVISHTINQYREVAALRQGKKHLVLFNSVNVSFIVEKANKNHKIPIPLVVEQAEEKSIEDIHKQIAEAKNKPITDRDIVLHRPSSIFERLYYHLPAFARRLIWQILLNYPSWVFKSMGNVSITSLSASGSVNGWFIPITIHPICFGIGSVIKKPVARHEKVVVGEVLNITVIFDHDIVDGAPMARFIKQLSQNIENGLFLSPPNGG